MSVLVTLDQIAQLAPSARSSYRDAFVFLLLILVLLVRPNGILGPTEREKV